MKILDWYIGKIVAGSTFITLTVFASVSAIILFVDQMKIVGRGNYDLSHAVLYVLYSVPSDLELFFPMAALVGGLIGIGILASNSELIVMQSAGMSKLNIISSVMKTAVLLMALNMAIGEWLSPPSVAFAREIKSQAISGGSLISSQNGVWLKDGDFFVHIGEVENTVTLNQIQIYRFNDDLKLTSWLSAEKATYVNNQWLLQKVTNTQVTDKKIIEQHYPVQTWVSSLTPSKLSVVTVQPESLSIKGLLDYLDYLHANQQDPSRYQLALWRKIVQPLTVAVMLLLAMSFIFGPLRSVSMGARIMMGIVTGLTFYICNEVFGSVSLVYQLPPLLGAVVPSLLFVTVAIYLMNKQAS